MANRDIKTDIPLIGPGQRARHDRPFGPGEYYKLVDVEIHENNLQNRRSIKSMAPEGTLLNTLPDALHILGYGQKYTFIASDTVQWYMYEGATAYQVAWAPTSLPTDGVVGSWHKIVHVFYYNERYYWITLEYREGSNTYAMYAHHAGGIAPFSSYASLTHVELFTFNLTIGSSPLSFCNAFVQGERLWIVSNHRVWFSKATDPSVFAVPDGGFFDFQNAQFTYGTFYRDTIYILATDSLYSINYNVDPNLDSVTAQISSNTGGSCLVVHDSTVYLVNFDGIYSVTNNTILKVLNHQFVERSISDFKFKLVSYKHYLVLLYYNENNFDGYDDSSILFEYKKYPYFVHPTNMTTNVVFINTENGSSHLCGFYDYSNGLHGHVVDIMFGPISGADDMYGVPNKEQTLVFLTRTNFDNGHLYVMDNNPESEICDLTVNNGEVKYMKKPLEVYIQSFTPEESQFNLNKFRNLLLRGVFPDEGFHVQVYLLDQNGFDTSLVDENGNAIWFTLEDVNAGTISDSLAQPYLHRIPINARAFGIGFKLAYDGPALLPNAPDLHRFKLAEAALLWAPTGRISAYRNASIDA